MESGGKGEGGLTCSSFFFTDYTENAVVLTSGLVCSLASNMQYCSNLLLLECIVTDWIWLKVVFSQMFGVVIVEENHE